MGCGLSKGKAPHKHDIYKTEIETEIEQSVVTPFKTDDPVNKTNSSSSSSNNNSESKSKGPDRVQEIAIKHSSLHLQSLIPSEQKPSVDYVAPSSSEGSSGASNATEVVPPQPPPSNASTTTNTNTNANGDPNANSTSSANPNSSRSRAFSNGMNGTKGWKKICVLGKGGFGEVYLARNDSGQEAAVKLMKFNIKDPSVMQMIIQLKREISTLQKVGDHPHLVKYYHSERRDEKIFIWMEYCPKGSLRKLYKEQGPIPFDTAAKFTRQLLLGLQHLHSLDIIHRDVKCDNVLVTEDDDVKLADFGSSRSCSEETPQTRIGTVFWMAPEVFFGNKYHREADIWSVGCTVWEMMSAEHPFANNCADYGSASRLLDRLNKDPTYICVINIERTVSIPVAVEFIRSCMCGQSERPDTTRLLSHPFVN